MASIEEATAHREGMWLSGFRPVAVYQPDPLKNQKGKRPYGYAWQKDALRDPPRSITDPPRPDALNTGILVTGLRALDGDIDDPAIARRVSAAGQDIFGPTIVRSRSNSARFLLPYRADGTPAGRTIAGEHGKVQLLGRGQQFVADGMHESGVAVQWFPAPPWEYPAANLPVVTKDQEAAFLREIVPIIGGRNIGQGKGRVRQERPADDWTRNDTGQEERAGFPPWQAPRDLRKFAMGGLADILAIARDRYPGGIVREGMRDNFGFAAAMLVAILDPGDALDRTLTFTRDIMETQFHADDLPSSIATAVRRAEKAAAGTQVAWRGRWVTPAYTPSRAFLVALLDVSREEQARLGLVAIASHAEHKLRKARAAGVAERAAYEAAAAERRTIVLMMRAQGAPFSEIAAKLSISKGEAHRLAHP